MTALAQLFFRDKANGQLIVQNEKTVGSRIIGQRFGSPGYFHSRPSAGGNRYDAANSGGSNFRSDESEPDDRVNGDLSLVQAENPGVPVPVDLITTSASGLDPDISPASAAFQVRRVASERTAAEGDIAGPVASIPKAVNWGLLGEPRVNVLELNLALDARYGAVAGK